MGIISVPMIDGDPVERGAKVAFGVRHQFSRKRSQVRQILRVFRRNDESEVMPIIATSFSEGLLIRPIRVGIKQTGVGPVAGYSITFQVCQMAG